MNTTHAWWRSGLLALVATVGLSACDSTNAALDTSGIDSPQLETMVNALADDLDLPEGTTQDLSDAVAARQDDQREPGFLWYVAADLQERLSDSQKADLFAKAEARREARRERMEAFRENRGDGERARRNRRGARQGGGDALERLRENAPITLTDEQKEAMQAVREQYAPQLKALREQVQAETLTREEAREQGKALREAMQAEIQAILTDEQKAALEAAREERQAKRAERKDQRADRREATRNAMIDALALTDEQQAAIAALRDEQKTERTATREQFRAARENGETIDRAALREQAREARTDHRTAMADIFTDDQQEIIQIHRILAQGAAKQMLQQRRGDGERRQGRRGMRRGR
ncbi:MAG: Spy/CpxP family protein refolding chaperone [Bacteroidota bacterium]